MPSSVAGAGWARAHGPVARGSPRLVAAIRPRGANWINRESRIIQSERLIPRPRAWLATLGVRWHASAGTSPVGCMITLLPRPAAALITPTGHATAAPAGMETRLLAQDGGADRCRSPGEGWGPASTRAANWLLPAVHRQPASCGPCGLADAWKPEEGGLQNRTKAGATTSPERPNPASCAARFTNTSTPSTAPSTGGSPTRAY